MPAVLWCAVEWSAQAEVVNEVSPTHGRGGGAAAHRIKVTINNVFRRLASGGARVPAAYAPAHKGPVNFNYA